MDSTEVTLTALLQKLHKHPDLPMITMDLERVIACLERLDNPHLKLPPTIHIAGTNGKGSHVAILRTLFEGHGKKVHAYTSPHLVCFHERIYLAGQNVSSVILLNALERVMAAAGADIPLTFFEATTIAAFVCFSEIPADVLLLEVGLGGRLDATNVIERPLLCVITPVDIDHTEFLGDSISAIAAEKAGIVKQGVPVVVSEQAEEARAMISFRADSLQCSCILTERNSMLADALSLEGGHQAVNLGSAIVAFRMACEMLNIHILPLEPMLKNVRWPARLQRITKGLVLGTLGTTELWLDGGHNASAGRMLSSWLSNQKGASAIILGMMARKDVAGFLEDFRLADYPIATLAIEGEPDAALPEMLAEIARGMGFSRVHASNSLEAAIEWHKDASVLPLERILICGSLYLAGKVLQNHA